MTTAERFRVAVEHKDLAAAGELLAPDVVFHSPVTFHPFLGRETVSTLLGEVAQVFEDFRYTDELEVD
jgi:ketosteroid isomerase-like protein